MADRRDYYFRQKVTEAELDAGFNGLEQADFNLVVDHGFIGIVEGMGVSEKSGTPDLSVDVQGPGTAYSKDGERINFASTQNVDVSQDDGGTPTTVGTPGNTKVVSVFIEFDRALSDPRIDGNSLTVYFQRDESFDFSVVQGAEAVIGSEVPPPLDSGKILLADIRIENGTTQILDAATVGAFDQIDFTRREYAFDITGGTIEVQAGTTEEAISNLITEINAHVDGTGNKHLATAIDAAISTAWHDTDVISSTNVDAVLEELIGDLASITGKGGGDKIGIGASTATFADSSTLSSGSIHDQIGALISALASTGAGTSGGDKVGVASQSAKWADTTNLSTSNTVYDQIAAIIGDLAALTAADSGTRKIGSEATPTNWADSTGLSAGTLFAQLSEILSDLAGTGAGSSGAHKAGSASVAGSPETLSGGSIYSQISALLGHVNDRAELAGTNTWSNKQTFNNGIRVDNDPIDLLEVDSEANMLLPKFYLQTANTAHERVLLFHSDPLLTTRPETRVYIEEDAIMCGLCITTNCSWNGTLWVQDNATYPSYALRIGAFGGGYIWLQKKDAGASNWNDSSWDIDGIKITLGNTFEQLTMTAENGILRFINPTDDSWASNIAKANTPNSNALYSKNIVKAWMYATYNSSGVVTAWEGFNFKTPENPGTATNITDLEFATALDDGAYGSSVCIMTNQNINGTIANEGGLGFSVYLFDADTGGAYDFDSGSAQISVIIIGTDS